jgi:hypothetical protein
MAETTTLELISPHRAGDCPRVLCPCQIGLSISVPNSPQRRKVRQVQEPAKKLLVQIRLLRTEKTRGLSPSFVTLNQNRKGREFGGESVSHQSVRVKSWMALSCIHTQEVFYCVAV